MIHLAIGRARSDKSRYAESLVSQYLAETKPIYVATAQEKDSEMRQRIEHHQHLHNQSGIIWKLIEYPVKLDVLLEYLPENAVILVDCLTLLLTNELISGGIKWQQNKRVLLDSLTKTSQTIILASNEVGSGIVPLGALSCQFIDEAGWLNQIVAMLADK